MYFATNIADFLACQHISTLERHEKLGEVEKTYYADPGAELLRKLGLEHEAKYLRALREDRGLNVVEISTEEGWEKAAKATREAMGRGVEAIYQATFLQGQGVESGFSIASGHSERAWTMVVRGCRNQTGKVDEGTRVDATLFLFRTRCRNSR
jgi:hypothetical protein